jgi:hypothetical protein
MSEQEEGAKLPGEIDVLTAEPLDLANIIKKKRQKCGTDKR